MIEIRLMRVAAAAAAFTAVVSWLYLERRPWGALIDNGVWMQGEPCPDLRGFTVRCLGQAQQPLDLLPATLGVLVVFALSYLVIGGVALVTKQLRA